MSKILTTYGKKTGKSRVVSATDLAKDPFAPSSSSLSPPAPSSDLSKPKRPLTASVSSPLGLEVGRDRDLPQKTDKKADSDGQSAHGRSKSNSRHCFLIPLLILGPDEGPS